MKIQLIRNETIFIETKNEVVEIKVNNLSEISMKKIR